MSLVSFYVRAGWQTAPHVKVVGGPDDGALTSDGLGKAVLIRLLSPRARDARQTLTASPINLGLPPGEFL